MATVRGEGNKNHPPLRSTGSPRKKHLVDQEAFKGKRKNFLVHGDNKKRYYAGKTTKKYLGAGVVSGASRRENLEELKDAGESHVQSATKTSEKRLRVYAV